jgi:hypothetical protein
LKVRKIFDLVDFRSSIDTQTALKAINQNR